MTRAEFIRHCLAQNGSHARNGLNRPHISLELTPALASVSEVETVHYGLIALGGTGKKVLLALGADTGDLPDQCFCAIDSDPDLCGLPSHCLTRLDLPLADRIVKNRKKYAAIDGVITPGFAPGKVRQGSSMKRMVSMMTIVYQHLKIREALSRRIVRPILERRTAGEKTRVAIVIIGSMGGGFGSGSKDAVAMIIRDLFRRQHPGIEVHIEWHCFTPDVHYDVLPLDWQTGRANALSVAALLETAAGHNDPSLLPYRELNIAEAFEGPIINEVRVYSAVNEHGQRMGTEAVYAMAANCIASGAMAAISNPAAAHAVNVVLAGKNAPYGGAAAYRFRYPARQVERYAACAGLARLIMAVVKPRLAGTPLAREAAGAFERLKMSRILADIEGALPAPPSLTIPQSANDRTLFPETLRRAREVVEGIWRTQVERHAAEEAVVLGPEHSANLEREYDELIAQPTRLTPADVRSLFETLLQRCDELAARLDQEIARNLPARQAAELEQALAQIDRMGWFAQRASARVAQTFRTYVAAVRRQAALRAAVRVLGECRPIINRLVSRANAVVEAVESAVPKLEELARNALQAIGARSDGLVVEAVDQDWVREMVGRVLASIDWENAARQILGPELPFVDGRRSLQRSLESSAEQVVEMLSTHLSVYSAASPDLPLTALDWLREVAGQAIPQFAFFEPETYGQQTLLTTMLACADEQVGRGLLDHFDESFRPELVATGDPHEIVLFAQRLFVPLGAAFPNLDAWIRDYLEWVEKTRTDPQAELHTTATFADANLLERFPLRLTAG